MKTFYTFISRILLVVFTSNCLMPTWSWAQLLDRNSENASARQNVNWDWKNAGTFGNIGGQDGTSGQNHYLYQQVAKAVGKTENKEDFCRKNIAAYYQAYLEAFQVKDMVDALNNLYFTADDCKEFIQKNPEQFPATIAATQTSASFEDYFKPTEHVLQDVVEFADRLVARQRNVSSGNRKKSKSSSSLAPNLNPANAGPAQDPYDSPYISQVRQQQAQLTKQMDQYVADAMENSFGAQVLAQTFAFIGEGYDQLPYETELVRLLEQMQLRLLHQLGGYVSQGKNGAPVIVLSQPTGYSQFPETYAEISLRGWARLALIRIHKVYKKMNLKDPLGDSYISTQMNRFKRELAQLQDKPTELSVASLFAFLFALEQGQDIKKVVADLEPTTKRNKFLNDHNDAIAVVLAQMQQVILADPQDPQSKRLFNDLVTMATDPKVALSTQVLALQNLAELKKVSDGSLNFGAVSAKLACHAGELYAPLVAQNYDSYGLDVGQMMGLSELLKSFYETFNGPKHFLDWKKGEIKGVLSVDYYNGRPIVRTDSALFGVESVQDIFTAFEAEHLAKQTAWKAKKCDGTEFTMYAKEHRNWFKESADLNKEFIKFFAEMIAFDGLFRLLTPVVRTMWGAVVSTPLRTVRGVAIALPDAAKAARAGKGLAGVRAELQQGIKVSNITGKLKAGQRVGIELQATERLADGTMRMNNVNSYHKLRNVLNNQNLQELALVQNGIKEYELTGKGLQELTSASKSHTWEVLTKNMNSVAGNYSLSMDALQGSAFKTFNPALKTAQQNLLRTKAIRQMAQEGGFDMWLGAPKTQGVAKTAKDFDWFMVREGNMDDFSRALLNKTVDENGTILLGAKDIKDIQVVLTPKYLQEPSLFPKKFGIQPLASPAESAAASGKIIPAWVTGPERFGARAGNLFGMAGDPMQLYVPVSQAEKISLLGDLATSPEAFGVTNKMIAADLGRAGLVGRFAGPGHTFGAWVGNANKFINMTGQSGIPYQYILKNALPFQEMWAGMGSLTVGWSAFIGADALAYQAGMQKWPERVAERDVNQFIDALPEISARKKDSAGDEESALSAHDVVAAKADPERSGALFGAPITMARYGLGKLGIGKFSFVSNELKEYLAYNENSLRFNNAMEFAGTYGGLHQALEETAFDEQATPAMRDMAAEYNTALEEIKNGNQSYYEKAQQAEQLVLSWNKDFAAMQYAQQETEAAQQRAAQQAAAEKTYSEQKEFIENNIALGERNGILTEQEIEEYRFQLHFIDKQSGSVSSKVAQAAALGTEIYLTICVRYYGERLVTELFLENGYRPSDFNDLISSYKRTIADLKNKSADADEFISAFEAFERAVKERANIINGASLRQR